MMEKSFRISVLMAAYHRDNVGWLHDAIRSMVEQTHPVEEIVIVFDGPVPESFPDAVKKAAGGPEGRAPSVKVVQLEKNVGLAAALNAGLPHCTGDWIARMDADDLSYPDRIRKQADFLREHPEIDFVSAWHAEFYENPENIVQFKTAPPGHDAICRKLPWRNVISHPTILARKSAFEKTGGYRSFAGLLEDHDLFLRMASNGVKLACLQEPLLYFRISRDHRHRRSGVKYAWLGVRLRARWYREGLTSLFDFIGASAGALGFGLIPPGLKSHIYKLLRKQAAS